MEKFDLVEIVSIITAIFALIVSMVQLRLTFRANIVLRVHSYINCTMLEIVNIGTLGAENVNIKFNNDDIKKIADLVNDETIKKWLTKFYWRFFTQQFKRSCIPDGPKVGTVSLSPRGDWRMPSDSDVRDWIREIEKI